MTDSEKLDLLLSKFTDVDHRIGTLESNVQEIKQRTASMEAEMRDMKLTLENEIRTNRL